MNLDILISGVGGQGSVLASRALALAAMEQGLAVRTSEVIGMAQREGSVVSHVRIGEELYGAIIPDRRADFLLGLELAETARALNKLKPGGTVLAGTTTIVPATVQLGLSTYDREAITNYIKKQAGKVFFSGPGGTVPPGGPCQDRQRGHSGRPFDPPGAALRSGPNAPGHPALCPRAIFRIKPARL